jgi:putative CocE/NonD family hydrolase
MTIFKPIRLFLFLAVFFLPLWAPAQQQTDPPAGFNKIEQMVPMRDGVRLHTIIYAPKTHSEPLPIILNRTPYGIDNIYRAFPGSLTELIDEGFIFAFQDIRGKFKSEGQFLMQRPPRGPLNNTNIDEGTDTYDTIEWMLKNVPGNNGRIGMTGTSYPGWLVMMAVIDPHPALKAVSELATPADMFLGDDFHHNGAFRLSYGFEYSYELETSNVLTNFNFDRYDTYKWYLELGPLSNANAKYFHGKLPTWENFVNHPNYDQFWQQQALISQIKQTRVPIMHVAGWWDQEDFYGPVKAYEILEKNDPNHLNYLVAGPWNHGGWNRLTGDKLGNIDFGSPASQYFRGNILRPWFAYYLKDKGKLQQPEAITFETGSNKWASFDSWPPRENVTPRNLYFQGGGQLSFDPPKGLGAPYDSYISDPARPVPYRHQPIEPTYNPASNGGSNWSTWLVEDQRFVDGRPDVLTFETEPLTEDIHVAGDIVTHLFASTTGTDSDWVIKLIDVYPESYPTDLKMAGYQLMIADEILRGRFRNSFSKPEPIPANSVVEYTIDLHTNNHAFLKGHRIMVQVQSTWFPLYDRNPQKFVPNIFKATESDFQKATQRVYHSGANASYIKMPIIEGGR